MNPALMVKLHPAGPWRIGPESGVRNRVDAIFHSDSLYSAVTQAMERLGVLDEWLDATAKAEAPAVCFSSCFPLLNGMLFVPPPRTVWPPGAASLASGRLRWKSARFVPLVVVRNILAGQMLDEERWTLDGPSGCLIPSDKQGPFRSSVRWSAAIDRLSGAAERHAVACIEFRSDAGLWSVASFAGEAARDTWRDRVKAAFRWLADSGFGGERSRGWGRAEAPEFVEGTMPEIIGVHPETESGAKAQVGGGHAQGPDVIFPPLQEPPGEQPPVTAPPSEPELPEPDPEPIPGPEPITPLPSEAAGTERADLQPLSSSPDPRPAPPARQLSDPQSDGPQWLLSLFSPSAADAIEWSRGNYSLIERGGRIESPAGSGGLKKQVQMVAEGSVLYAVGPLRGAAPDVAPDGFAHPVFRAGFAVAVPLPEAG
jgi:CRISPR type III-A-associated RAMP protein Csm4